MNFSAERFAEVMSHLNPQVRAHGGSEKRRAQRLRQRGELTVIPYTSLGAGKPAPVQLRDFSTRGVRIISRKLTLAHGDEFLIMLPRKNQRPIPMLCTVVHAEPTDDGLSIGAEFVCVAPGQRPSEPCADSDAPDVDRIRHSMLD